MLRILLIIYLLYFLFLCCPDGKRIEVIEGINSPHQVQWISDSEVLIVKNQYIYKYNIYLKSFEKLGERNPNSIVSLNSKGELFFCEFEHFIINSPDEFSTIFNMKDRDGNLIKEIKIFETIRPVWMSEHEIYAVTAVDFLEEHHYMLDIETGEKEEIEEEYPLDIPRYIDVRRVFVRDQNLYLIEDMNGNLILYNIVINTKTIMPTLTAVFNPVPIKNPTNDMNPNFTLLLKSFFANIYSKSVAPKNAPIKTPRIFPIIPPIIEPTIDPIEPYLDPPAFLVPSAPANSSRNVERRDITKSITSVNGLIV